MRRFLRHFPPSAFKFAIFALICAVLAVILGAKIGNISLFTSRHALYAQMSDVTGLTAGNTVDIAGVPVGQVSSISVQRGHAVIGLSVDNSVELHRSTDIGMRWHNVIGQKEIYLYPNSAGPVLAAGSTIPLSHDVSDASVDAFLNSFGPFLHSINPQQANAFVENVSGALQNDTAEINQLINNGAVISKTVGDLNAQVGSVITNLDQVLTAIATRSNDVGSLITNLQTVAQSLSSRNNLLDSVVVNLGQVAGDLGNLIATNRTDLNSSVTDLLAVSQDIQSHQQQLATTLSTLGSGLAPYIQISSYGQWFQIQTVYTCLANQTACAYYQPTNPPAGSGPLGGLPLAATRNSSAHSTSAPAPSAQPQAAQPSIASILRTLAGQGGATTSAGGGP